MAPTPHIIRTPEDRFADLHSLGFPFSPHYINIQGYRIHYVDEGPKNAKNVVLCLHGEPSWSFLYRKMIPLFVSAGHRVVAPDFIGFGRSDKLLRQTDYSHHLHMSTLINLVEELNLNNITLVVQDWGGTTGLTSLESFEQRVNRIVIMNAGLPPHGSKEDFQWLNKRKFAHNAISLIGWRATMKALGQHVPVGRFFAMSCPGISPGAWRGYDAPFPDARYKAGVAWWPQKVALTSRGEIANATARAKAFLKTWKRPAFVLFSDGCPVSSSLYDYFQGLVPGAASYPAEIVKGAGHFLQEDAGADVADRIVSFMTKT